MRRGFAVVAAVIVLIVAGRMHVSQRGLSRGAAPGGIVSVVVLGDSLAHGAGDESGLGIAGRLSRELHASVVNCGINGARTFNVLRVLQNPRVDRLLRSADAVIVSIGGNDLYGDSPARLLTTLWPRRARHRVATRVASIVHRVEQVNPYAHILLLGVYNPYKRVTFLDTQVNEWDSMLIARFAADRRVTVITIADLLATPERLSSIDHFHPSQIGYALIAARVAPVLQSAN